MNIPRFNVQRLVQSSTREESLLYKTRWEIEKGFDETKTK